MQQARKRRGKGVWGGEQTAKNTPSPNCQLIQLKKSDNNDKNYRVQPSDKINERYEQIFNRLSNVYTHTHTLEHT